MLCSLYILYSLIFFSKDDNLSYLITHSTPFIPFRFTVAPEGNNFHEILLHFEIDIDATQDQRKTYSKVNNSFSKIVGKIVIANEMNFFLCCSSLCDSQISMKVNCFHRFVVSHSHIHTGYFLDEIGKYSHCCKRRCVFVGVLKQVKKNVI